ncbi:MAG TPA: tRNA (guanosine(37)-N1)-methyltransferase TrmD [Proteobacteria bacterium]|nr:tRNA (guanosine(37)-N1)-methyltransferase TrmD [Pseudomonadota bacterium]
MQIDIITLFPGMFAGFLTESIIKRAQEKGVVNIGVIDLRDYTHDRHRTADDRPYGGGAGMVLKVEPLFEAVEALKTPESTVILLSPRGETFGQAKAGYLSRRDHLILICGHYEGVDERVCSALVDEEISIGDYILTGGELPAMVVADSVIRLIPGVLGDPDSSVEESFAKGRLEYPHYTRPSEYRGMAVPGVLLSGDHGEVARWREEQSFITTSRRRPDLIKKFPPTEKEKKE